MPPCPALSEVFLYPPLPVLPTTEEWHQDRKVLYFFRNSYSFAPHYNLNRMWNRALDDYQDGELMLGDCPSLTFCDRIALLWWLVASYLCCFLFYIVFSASLGELFKFAFYILCQRYLEEGRAWFGGTHFHEIIGKDKDAFHAIGILVSFRMAEFITKIPPGSEKESRKIPQRPLHRWPYNYGSHDFCHQWTPQFLLTMLLDSYHVTASFCYSEPIILFPPERLYTVEKVEEEEKQRGKILNKIMDKKFPSQERKYSRGIRKHRQHWWNGSAGKVPAAWAWHLNPSPRSHSVGRGLEPQSCFLTYHTHVLWYAYTTHVYTIKNIFKNLNRSPNNSNSVTIESIPLLYIVIKLSKKKKNLGDISGDIHNYNSQQKQLPWNGRELRGPSPSSEILSHYPSWLSFPVKLFFGTKCSLFRTPS